METMKMFYKSIEEDLVISKETFATILSVNSPKRKLINYY